MVHAVKVHGSDVDSRCANWTEEEAAEAVVVVVAGSTEAELAFAVEEAVVPGAVAAVAEAEDSWSAENGWRTWARARDLVAAVHVD